ncbi:hypothetical protein U1Q18_040360 [Sarracenia purpurea var. burkii]
MPKTNSESDTVSIDAPLNLVATRGSYASHSGAGEWPRAVNDGNEGQNGHEASKSWATIVAGDNYEKLGDGVKHYLPKYVLGSIDPGEVLAAPADPRAAACAHFALRQTQSGEQEAPKGIAHQVFVSVPKHFLGSTDPVEDSASLPKKSWANVVGSRGAASAGPSAGGCKQILGIEDPCKRGFWLSGQGKLVVPSGVGENMVISVLEKMILLRFRSIAIYMWCRIWFSKIGLLSFCANLEILVLSNRAVVEGCLNSVFQAGNFLGFVWQVVFVAAGFKVIWVPHGARVNLFTVGSPDPGDWARVRPNIFDLISVMIGHAKS